MANKMKASHKRKVRIGSNVKVKDVAMDDILKEGPSKEAKAKGKETSKGKNDPKEVDTWDIPRSHGALVKNGMTKETWHGFLTDRLFNKRKIGRTIHVPNTTD